MLKDEIKQAIFALQKQYPVKRSALIPALLFAQKQEGYLSLTIQAEVAALFELDPNEINAIVTFYDMLYDHPMGKHLVHLCKNVSCMLKGSDELTASICQKLNVKISETTEDGKYTVLQSECLGACDRAPMMILDEKVFGPLKQTDLDQIFKCSHE